MRVKVVEGAIVSIPFESTYGVCKVLYVSKYFKNIALLKVFSEKLDKTQKHPIILKSDSFELIYTATKLIKNGTWPIIGTEPLSKLDREANKRIVGGDVWVADECMGGATDSELKSLPEMNVFNVIYLEGKVSKFPLKNGCHV